MGLAAEAGCHDGAIGRQQVIDAANGSTLQPTEVTDDAKPVLD